LEAALKDMASTGSIGRHVLSGYTQGSSPALPRALRNRALEWQTRQTQSFSVLPIGSPSTDLMGRRSSALYLGSPLRELSSRCSDDTREHTRRSSTDGPACSGRVSTAHSDTAASQPTSPRSPTAEKQRGRPMLMRSSSSPIVS
jgi:hypothetical protein